jgi:hypothetical protein
VEIPNSVTTIGASAFSGCIGLTTVEIPDSVTTIGDYAFNSCAGLTTVKIPNSVTTISYSAFMGLAAGSTIYCQTQEVKDLLVADTNYTSANTTVIVDASKFE